MSTTIAAQRMERAFEVLTTTLYAAADEVRKLRTPAAKEYANAILGKNGFGSDTTEIYLYRFATKKYRHLIEDNDEYSKFMSDLEKSRNYRKICLRKWAEEILKVNEIVGKYGGRVSVNTMPLQKYLQMIKDSGDVPDHRVYVQIIIPGQDKAESVRELAKRL